jgi:hypothetical protein
LANAFLRQVVADIAETVERCGIAGRRWRSYPTPRNVEATDGLVELLMPVE